MFQSDVALFRIAFSLEWARHSSSGGNSQLPVKHAKKVTKVICDRDARVKW
jgi:hypothetical protein